MILKLLCFLMFSKYFYPNLQHEFWYPKSNQKCTRKYSHIDKNIQSDKYSCYEQNTEILHNGMPKSVSNKKYIDLDKVYKVNPFQEKRKTKKT